MINIFKNYTEISDEKMKFQYKSLKKRIFLKKQKSINERSELCFIIFTNEFEFEILNIDNYLLYKNSITNIEDLKLFFDSFSNSTFFIENEENCKKILFLKKNSRSKTIYNYKDLRFLDFAAFFNLTTEDLKNKSIIEEYKKITNVLGCENIYNYNSIFNYSIRTGLKKLINKKSFIDKGLDLNFLNSFKPAWAEVFKIRESRKDRKIIVLDVNSMFPYCMTMKNFTEIDQMICKKINNDKESELFLNKIKTQEINNGISIVTFTLKEDLTQEDKQFIENFNYLNLYIKGENFFFNNLSNKIFQTHIHNTEIERLSKYFEFKIIEIIYSINATKHYLSNSVEFLYKKKLENKDDLILKNILKTSLVSYHSVTNKSIMKVKKNYFKSQKEAVCYFKNILGIKYLAQWKNILFSVKKHLKDVYIKEINFKNDKIEVITHESFHLDTTQIYSLPSQIYANSRVVLFTFLELCNKYNIENRNEVEVCYMNIDSVHLSIKETEIELFLSYIKSEISQTQIGKFKIEGIFDTGIWFDPGRYWLFNYGKDGYEVKVNKSSVFQTNNNNKWIVSKKFELLDKYGFPIIKKHYLFFSTQYNKIFLKKNKNNIILKKIDIEKLFSNKFDVFMNKITLIGSQIKKDVFYYFKKNSK